MRLLTVLLVLFSYAAFGQEEVSHMSLDSFNRMKAERDMQFLNKPYPVFKAINEKGEITKVKNTINDKKLRLFKR